MARTRKDRDLGGALDATIYKSRVAGLSERAIYEGLRDTLDTPPSYRDVRASLAKQGVRYKREATAARRHGRFGEERGEGRGGPMRESRYQARLAVTKRVDRRPEAKDDLDRKFLLGYMARSGVDAESLADPDLADSLDSIYDGFGS
jgi:hypothetical protein